MLKNIGISILSAVLVFTQVGCATMSSTDTTNSADTNSAELVIHSETEEKIMKQAAVAGTVGGIAVTAILLKTIGSDWPLPIQIAIGIGGPIAIKKLADFIALEQIAMLKDVTLTNDKQEKLLTEARKINAETAKLNSDLKASIKKYKKNQEGLPAELAKAKANQEKAKLSLENRKHLLNMMVKGSSQYKEYSKEVKVLEKENIKLSSTIKELNNIEAGAV